MNFYCANEYIVTFYFLKLFAIVVFVLLSVQILISEIIDLWCLFSKKEREKSLFDLRGE